ncbi:hypothetical protein D3C79_790860 [compost metagenome]
MAVVLVGRAVALLPVAGFRAVAVPVHPFLGRKPQCPFDGAVQLSGQRHSARHAGPCRGRLDLLHRPRHQRLLQARTTAHGPPGYLVVAHSRNSTTHHAPDLAGHLAVRAGDGLPVFARLGHRCLQRAVCVDRFDDFTGCNQRHRPGCSRFDPYLHPYASGRRVRPGGRIRRDSDRSGDVHHNDQNRAW